MPRRFLNLTKLADANVDEFTLVRFEGREAISELFDYSLEIVTQEDPDISKWIGKGVEFNVAPSYDRKRDFGGQIHEVSQGGSGANFRRYIVRVRPAFAGTLHARGISFYQDKTSLDILKDLTSTLTGFQHEVKGAKAPKRAYAVKYEETEYEFLTRMFAQDGIYFLLQHDAANQFFHKMVLASSPSAYRDVEFDGELAFEQANRRNSISSLQRTHLLHPHLHGFAGAAINALDQTIEAKQKAQTNWSRQLGSRHYENFAGVANQAELDQRATAALERREQDAELINGSSSVPQLYAGGRIPSGPKSKVKLVLASITHVAVDPVEGGGRGSYRNSFVAMDAARTFRPPVPTHRRRSPGPIVGVVTKKGASEGQIEVDKQARIPVWVTHAHPRGTIIWLQVQQAWAHADYGTQFIPRIGTQVMIDFLYGDPDLPFVSGCFYTPSQKYPFPLPDKRTRSGWRSKTEKNGGVVQEIMFEDKAGGEEIHMYTGRNFRRQVDKDELATINENNRKEVKKDQTLKVIGKRDVTVEKTQSVVVTQKALFESKKEIEIKVGQSTIKLTQQGIEINAPKIEVNSQTTINVKASGKISESAPMVEISGDGLVKVQGGIVKIN